MRLFLLWRTYERVSLMLLTCVVFTERYKKRLSMLCWGVALVILCGIGSFLLLMGKGSFLYTTFELVFIF